MSAPNKPEEARICNKTRFATKERILNKTLFVTKVRISRIAAWTFNNFEKLSLGLKQQVVCQMSAIYTEKKSDNLSPLWLYSRQSSSKTDIKRFGALTPTHPYIQGSLLFSKFEFSIKPDLRGLSFS